MPLTTRTITGLCYEADGTTPLAGGTVEARLAKPSYTLAASVSDVPTLTTTTDSTGAWSLDLWCDEDGLTPTSWLVYEPDNPKPFKVNVTAGASITVYALAAAGAVTTPLDTVQTLLDGKEDALGTPDSDGYVLSSTTAGVRSWVAQSGSGSGGGSGDMLASTYDTDGDGKVNAAETADSVPWSGVSSPPTTLAGYGITDAVSSAALATETTNRTNADSTHAALTSGTHGITAAGAALTTAASASAQRTALGLGSAATTDTTAYDAAGAASSAIATHEADTTNVHGIADTAALVLTNDSRLTNSRTPTPHASTHAAAGSDALTLAQSQITNLVSDLAAKATTSALTSHTTNTSNPHNVTAAQAGALATANNLSDLASASTARTNLGLGSAATQASSAFAAATHAASHTNGADQIADATTLASGLMSASDKTKLNGVASGATANTGTVTSVDLSVPGTLYTVSGSPVTTSGTLALALKTQSANTVLAGPTTGAAATPTMRALVAADVPSLDAAKLTSGTIATARLGSGTASSSTYLRGDQTYATPPNTLPPLALYWSANGDIYFVAHEAMTLSTATEAGTGTLTYTKALAASPTSFSGTTLPVTLAAGDVLKVTCASIGTYKAATLPRTA